MRQEPAQPRRRFVPLDVVDPAGPPSPTADAPIVLLGEPAEGWEARTSLFGELDR